MSHVSCGTDLSKWLKLLGMRGMRTSIEIVECSLGPPGCITVCALQVACLAFVCAIRVLR